MTSVTRILGATSEGKERLAHWLKRPDSAAISAAACERGTWTHAQIEAWIDGEPNTPHFAYGGYFRNIRPWLEAHVHTIIAKELPLWHPAGFAGTFDALGHISTPSTPPTALTLIDWKTSARRRTADLVADYFAQLGAYRLALAHTYGVEVDGAALVIARPTGSTPDVWELDAPILRAASDAFLHRLDLYYALPSDDEPAKPAEGGSQNQLNQVKLPK